MQLLLQQRTELGNAIWLIQLRWVAVVGQLLTIFVVNFALQIDLPLRQLAFLIASTAVTNVLLHVLVLFLARQSEKSFSIPHLLTIVMAMDLVVLTGLLYWTGGMLNPFASFYFVNLAVSGLLVRPIYCWMLALLAILGVASLLILDLPNDVAVLERTGFAKFHEASFLSLSKQGYLFAFTTCSIVVTFFITMLRREILQQERLLQQAEREKSSSQRLEAMATLAAGAGHELASPLSTIAVVSKELSHTLDPSMVPAGVIRDVELIRSELDRCKEILGRMKSGAGDAAAERLDRITAIDLLEEVKSGLREPDRVHLLLREEDEELESIVPVQAVALAIKNLVQNALDASPVTSTVSIGLEATTSQAQNRPKEWTITIRDQGCGIAADILEQVGNPFFTTKEPGQGMGLGVFLSRNVIQRINGTLSFQPNTPSGTVCRVTLPVRVSGSSLVANETKYSN